MARDEKPSAQPLVDERAELGIEASAAPHSLEQALHLLLLRRLLQDHASAADANRGGWCVEKAGRERLEEPGLPAMVEERIECGLLKIGRSVLAESFEEQAGGLGVLHEAHGVERAFAMG